MGDWIDTKEMTYQELVEHYMKAGSSEENAKGLANLLKNSGMIKDD